MTVRVLAALVLLVAPAWGQDVAVAPTTSLQPTTAPACNGTCVPQEDMEAIVAVLREKKCLLSEAPKYDLDPITIIVDEDGRIFFTGADPKPYTLKMDWCSYKVEAQGTVKVVVAMREPSTWGFRFRPKAYLGYLPLEPLVNDTDAKSGIDAGLMLDFFHIQWANVNVAVGFRSTGLGIGVDITKNFGAYAGYALAWNNWSHNANTALWFAF